MISSTTGQEMTSREMLGYYLNKSYADAAAAKERGELICWSSSIAPNEFCEAMGIHVIYPENHAAAVAAKGGALDLLEVAEKKGYSIDLCSYARINLAYMDVQNCVAENIPLPDFVIVCNNICNTLLKWYENICTTLHIPMILIDVPFNYEDEISERSLDYIADQFVNAIRQMEEITGKKFDYDKFDKAMEVSRESVYWWTTAMGKASALPSPLNGFDIFNYMALIVCMRGQEGCRDTFKKLAEELQAKIDAGIGAYKDGEVSRFMWEGIAVWPYLSHNFKTFKGLGMNMTGSTYPVAWALEYEKGDLKSMARAYTSIANNMSLKNQIDLRARVIKEYNCDGVTYHMNRSCKVMDFLQAEMQRGVEAATGVPCVSFDGDQSDPRNFSKAQFETRIQGLAEMIAQKKQEGGQQA